MKAASEAPIFARMGAPRSGKTAGTKIDIKAAAPARLMIWDPKREYEDCAPALPSLVAVYRAAKGKRFGLRYVPHGALKDWRAQFDAFCQVALEAGSLTLVADELADVTQPGWAPDGWEIVTRQSAHHHLIIYGLSQTPAGVDKTFLNNASNIRTGRLGSEGNIKAMADALMVPVAEIRALRGTQFIEIERVSGEVTRGDVFPKAKPARAARKGVLSDWAKRG